MIHNQKRKVYSKHFKQKHIGNWLRLLVTVTFIYGKNNPSIIIIELKLL